MTVPVENGRSDILLAAGSRYVMHDVEVAGGRQAGVFAVVEPLPPRPRRFQPGDELSGRLVLPFIGGMGDAVAMLPILGALRRRHPPLRVDVAATRGPAEVFVLSPHLDHISAYPTPLETWCGYDHYLTMEAVAATTPQPGRALTEVFADALQLELADSVFELNLPRALEAVDERSSVPVIAITVGDSRTLRSYPQSSVRELVSRLVGQGLCCVLLGHADPDWIIPVRPPVITDMRARTPTVLELAVWLRAADVVVCHDSFGMHLAGALNRPAVGLFAPTSRAHASSYGSVAALASAAPCAPCHCTGLACPRGLDRCVAWDSAAVAPAAVAQAVVGRLVELGRLAPPATSRRAVA